jgi:hypothetical protein
VVSFKPRPLYPQGKSPWYSLDRRLGDPQSRSGHGGDAFQLLVFIQVFSGGNIKEEPLKRYRYMGRLEVNTFKSSYASLLEMNDTIHKLVSITTDGAPAMASEKVGLIGL